MKKGFSPFTQEPPKPKASKQLVSAFCDTYKPVPTEEAAEEVFTIRKLREYFNAWPLPKSLDPLPPYLEELEERGYGMQTGYEGSPAIFCVRWRSKGEVCTAQPVIEEDDTRRGAESMRQLIERRLSERTETGSVPYLEDDSDENEEDETEDDDD